MSFEITFFHYSDWIASWWSMRSHLDAFCVITYIYHVNCTQNTKHDKQMQPKQTHKNVELHCMLWW